MRGEWTDARRRQAYAHADPIAANGAPAIGERHGTPTNTVQAQTSAGMKVSSWSRVDARTGGAELGRMGWQLQCPAIRPQCSFPSRCDAKGGALEPRPSSISAAIRRRLAVRQRGERSAAHLPSLVHPREV